MQEQDSKITFKKITDLKKSNLLGVFEKDIPLKPIHDFKNQSKKKFRNRVYSLELTLSGMLYQASQDDKSEQNTVLKISQYHNDTIKTLQKTQEELLENASNEVKPRKIGRPKRIVPKIQRSKLNPISLNTSSFDEARQRMPVEVMRKVFEETTTWFKAENQINSPQWHGRDVYAGDGSTFKVPDTPELRKYFDSPTDSNPPPLPIGRLQGLINLYGGGLVGVAINTYGSSEARMMKKLYQMIPKGAVFLGDDLYSSYGHIAYCQCLGIDIITQGKHKRKEKIIKQLSANDQIVEWSANIKPDWYEETDDLPATIQLRKITYTNPKKTNQKCFIYTTLLDEKKFLSSDIIVLYLSRWEIELSFLQIKVILMMEYLRGKTIDMVYKEIYAHLILYNLLRKIIKESCSEKIGTFSPCSEAIQIGASMVKGPYIDKLGRSYTRWRGGRGNI